MSQLTFDDPAEIEEWRDVPGYEGLYLVSSLGRVRSLPRNSTRGGLMKLRTDPDGYIFVTLSRGGIQKPHAVHRLAASAFIGTRPPHLETCHNDGNAANNRRGNLRYDTKSGNTRDKALHGTDHNINKTHCPSGHEYTEENTEYRPNAEGGLSRFCLACRKINARRSYERRKAAGLPT